MLIGCPLPDELDGASIGQRAVDNAFKAILSSAAKKYHTNLYDVMCDAHKRQGLDQRRLDIRPVKYIFIWLGAISLILLSIVSAPTGIIMGPISAGWWSRSC